MLGSKYCLIKKLILFIVTGLIPLIVQGAEVQLVYDINPGNNRGVYDAYGGLIPFNEQLCFAGDDGTSGAELWCYDGTNPPSLVKDIYPGFLGSLLPHTFVVFNNVLYFSADDGVHGQELWAYNGVDAPTMVADLIPGAKSSAPDNLIVFNNQLYFIANHEVFNVGIGTNTLAALWSYDGINTPTIVVQDFPDKVSVGDFTLYNDALYFAADSGLWYYSVDTSLLRLTPAYSYPDHLTIFNNQLYLTIKDNYLPSSQMVFWEGHTTLNTGTDLARLEEWPNRDVAPLYLGVFKDKLYFTAPRFLFFEPSDTQFWSYNGTHSPTPVFDFNPLGNDHISGLQEWDNTLYLSATDGINGHELWSYDGTTVPTLMADINPTGSSSPSHLTVFKDKLYFVANDGEHGRELYVLEDPTPANGPCQLYAVHDEQLNDSQFFTVDETLTVTALGELYNALDIEGLDLHPNEQQLFASSGDDTSKPGFLYQVDTQTGRLTEIGATGFAEVDALTFHPRNGSLWGWAQGSGLIKINSVSGVATLKMAYAGEIEALTWDAAGTTLYAAENIHQSQADAEHDDLGMRLWRYDVDSGVITEACELDALSAEIEALEALREGHLLFSYHGDNKIYSGTIVFPTTSTCDIIQFEPIITQFNDIEGLAYPSSCFR